MKIIVLHGDDFSRSYERLKVFVEIARERNWETIYVDESPLSLPETVSGTSLFASERFFILRNIKLLGKKEIDWLNKKYADLPGNFVLYSEGVLPRSLLDKLPGSKKVEEFKFPKTIYAFLESLYPGNSAKAVMLLHQVLSNDAAEYVLALIAKYFRDLYWANLDSGSIPYPAWRVGKLKSQSSKFTMVELKSFIESLSELDMEVKTSNIDLASQLDLLIITKLQ